MLYNATVIKFECFITIDCKVQEAMASEPVEFRYQFFLNNIHKRRLYVTGGFGGWC